MSMRDVKTGDTIKAGQFLLFTSGEYSSYGVNGLYRAKVDFVVPGKADPFHTTERTKPDQDAIAINPDWVEEVAYLELWA